jgi:hypothetical protein
MVSFLTIRIASFFAQEVTSMQDKASADIKKEDDQI